MSSKKSVDVLLKSIRYFGAKSILIPDNPKVEKNLRKSHAELIFQSKTIDLLYASQLTREKFEELLLNDRLHNSSMILLEGNHETKEKEDLWKSLTSIPEITVSIDMFYCGALFIRKEQVKEHFTIRI